MNSKNFQFLLQAFNTECTHLNFISYDENVKTILQSLDLLSNLSDPHEQKELLLHIALHLNQNLFTGSHSYYFNSQIRQSLQGSLSSNIIVMLLNRDFTQFYPEYYKNNLLTEKQKVQLRKQTEHDMEIIRARYEMNELGEIDTIYFKQNCEDEIVELIDLENEVNLRTLKEILYDMFINKKERKTGKQFTKEFHEKISTIYPYEYLMYKYFSEL